MCLAVPAKIVAIDKDSFSAEIDVMGNIRTISVMLTPDADLGSWVLVHAGQAINVVSDEEAQASIEIWEEILREQG
ncbi:MAG TPA: HypC/HybG/HupF family hydrogenase formation chaperone [Actinobacteria bacterium]|jgi:hydrogenase expression/formation protein HypC|nr:HypC/HybG/HupF family hydrogenase formation chaperone [Actinomycetota bacterium]